MKNANVIVDLIASGVKVYLTPEGAALLASNALTPTP